MAEEEKEESQENEGSASKESGGSKIVLILIVVLLVLVLAIGGVVAYLMLSGDEAEDATVVKQEKVERKRSHRSEDAGVGPMYPLDKFTVNLMSENGRRFLVVKMNLEEDSEELTPELDKKTPLVRDVVISILSSKTVEEITTAKGKEKLKDEIIAQINRHLDDGEIRHIYFTEFVIQ
ncbi:flagellar basal body-associated protein FliL [Hydrogenimonas sp.]|uniref:flagellar basal body-associated protein FliL n=1 Tax=Hydrogenimonas sp. TaxID=2231112 RepID=UPI0026283CA7|nr:flagellar basal body-associated protein FliL [Hydrogenimonas sp.]